MHPSLQAKLLRALQEKEITRVGNNDPVKVDVRIIATSNRDLEASVGKGEFREDLYFRLNVVNLRLPALRERKSDIPELAQFFADKYAEQNGTAKKPLSAEAKDRLMAHSWRGNIRELENTMHRSILISMEDEIEASAIHLQGMAPTNMPAPAAKAPDPKGVSPATSAAAPASADLKNPVAVGHLVGRTIADVERDMIVNTLDHCLGNRTHAANILGISIRTLRNKLAQYREEGIDIPMAAGDK